MQKIIVMGFVGRDPEEKYTSNGTKLTTFPLGINYTKGGEKLTVWYKINCWVDQCSNILPYIKKGKCITVMGELSPPTTYQNKKGDIAVDMSIKCQSIDFIPMPKEKAPQETKEDPAVFDFGGN